MYLNISKSNGIRWVLSLSVYKNPLKKPSQIGLILVKIGVDETSHKKGHRYMTAIANHETGNLIWAKKGHGKEILLEFFEELFKEQRVNIMFVTADGARLIANCVMITVRTPSVVAWANDYLDEVRNKPYGKQKQILPRERNRGTLKKRKSQDPLPNKSAPMGPTYFYP